jgi:hypothetical protein
MKNVSSLFVLGFAAATVSARAAEVDLSKLPPAAKKDGVTYAKDIKPLFEASCFGCHSDKSQRPSAGLRLDSLEAALKGGVSRNGTNVVIEPGKSEKSKLVIAVARLDRNAMPPTPRARRGGPGGPGGPGAAGTNAPAAGAPGAPAGGGMAGQGPGGGRGPAGPPPKNLTSEEVGLVRAWIDQGAK